MKKSIVAMLSITALATVANADPFTAPTGTHFNTTTPGEPFYGFLDDGGSNTGPFYWFAATDVVYYCESQFGTYTNTADIGSYTGDRPEIATNYVGQYDRCLSIDTEGGRLYRRMAGDTEPANGVDTFPQYDVTSSLFFDSLVQFTVNEDEAPTIQTGDKLAVWLKGGETTNLVITAGYVDSSGVVTPTNYVIDTAVKNVLPGVWHRLTIESFLLTDNADAGNGYIGFRVRIDGDYLTTTQAKMNGLLADCVGEMSGAQTIDEPTAEEWQKLFPSLAVANGEVANCDTLSCVAFEGTGAVDDLTFTPNDPFGGVEPPPAEPGYVEGGITNTYSDATAFVTAFKSGKVLALPEGWVFNAQTGEIGPENGTAFATVPAYYNVAADGTISLNETVVKPVLGTTEGTGDDPDTEPITVGATTVTLNVTNGKAGLYYGVRKYATLGGTSSDSWNTTAQAEDGNVTLTVDKTANATAEFYQVIVTDIAPAAPTPEPGN